MGGRAAAELRTWTAQGAAKVGCHSKSAPPAAAAAVVRAPTSKAAAALRVGVFIAVDLGRHMPASGAAAAAPAAAGRGANDVEFVFEPGVFGYEWPMPALAVVAYLVAVAVLKRWINVRRRPLDLRLVTAVWSAALSMLSAVLFVTFAAEVFFVRAARTGVLDVLLDPHSQHSVRGRLVWLCWVNYVFKFVELGDTLLLCLRGKPTPALHVYHHAATLVLCWTQLRAESCCQWMIIIVNLLIHVVMYFYYTMAAVRVRVWWKRYLTHGQIAQFVFAVVGCIIIIALRHCFDAGLLGVWARGHSRSYVLSYLGPVILLSYLVLFIDFERRTYQEKKTE